MSAATDDDTTSEGGASAVEPAESSAAPSGAASRRVRVAVPAWVMGLVALLAVAGLGFGVARWTDSGSGDHGRPAAGAEQRGPDARGNQSQDRGPNGPGNDGRPDGPRNQNSQGSQNQNTTAPR